MTNTLTMGYRMGEDGEIIVDAREQRVLRIVEEQFRQGEGTSAIARTLNAAGLTNRNGNPFTPQMVTKYVKRLKERAHHERTEET